ncbi:MAG: hypothetical protein VYD25_10650 [Pseudomonadota bacterium]|nr:hypothetical protein [Pseudomonadota bacterium]
MALPIETLFCQRNPNPLGTTGQTGMPQVQTFKVLERGITRLDDRHPALFPYAL